MEKAKEKPPEFFKSIKTIIINYKNMSHFSFSHGKGSDNVPTAVKNMCEKG